MLENIGTNSQSIARKESSAGASPVQIGTINLRVRILMVEDERLIAARTEQVLREAGFHYIVHATSGEMALRIAETFKPDILLMDFTLKGTLNGLQTAIELRRKRMLPVIFATACSRQIEENEKLLDSYFLTKPIHENLLLSLVTRLSHYTRM